MSITFKVISICLLCVLEFQPRVVREVFLLVVESPVITRNKIVIRHVNYTMNIHLFTHVLQGMGKLVKANETLRIVS